MERNIPVWLLLLLMLLWALITVAFGWAVKAKLAGQDAGGWLGDVAVGLASFPDLALNVIGELSGYASGDYADAEMRVEREPDTDLSEFEPVPTAVGLDVQGPLLKRHAPELAPGWRLLSGAFTVDGRMENAALLLSPDLVIVKRWILDEIAVDGVKPRPKHRKFVHGIALLGDGSLIFTFDGSVSLQRIDACGKRLWATGGNFHHAVTLDESGHSVWTFAEFEAITEVSVADGAVLRSIAMDDIIAANPMTDILEIRRYHDNDINRNSRETDGAWLHDPFHLNDVEPLPAAIADRFAEFSAGDLLISARSLNLLFIIDPDTLHIKWWRVGMTQRQHDPDWLPTGEIAVFNNRMSRDFSELIAIHPATFQRRLLVDGRRHDFYTRIRGKHQLYPAGHHVISSPQQGRAFELDRNGGMTLEVVNPKPGSDTYNYVISEMQWFPTAALPVSTWRCPPAG